MEAAVRPRTTNPELLHKKDRGRPTEAVLTLQRRGYGEQEVLESVPGAEVLRLNDVSQEQQEDQKQDEVPTVSERRKYYFSYFLIK
jgi:protein SDA1